MTTTADLLALPEDGIERWLVDGQIVAIGPSIRDKHHSRTAARVSHLLLNWVDGQPGLRGSVHTGGAGVRLCKNPERTVGVDVVYLAPELAAVVMTDEATTIIDAVPPLAVEILSLSDVSEDISRKVKLYRDAGVPLVWVIDPDFRTVTVHRPGAEPVMLNATQELDGGDVLPGFRVPVARLFPG
jgi:Uma2 family endonuclease